MFKKNPFGQLIRYSVIFLLINTMQVDLFAQTSASKSNKNSTTELVLQFKNQGEQEDYWVKDIFVNKYKRKIFKRYNKLIGVDGDSYQYGEQVIIVYAEPQLKKIFEKGIFYPEVLDDHYTDDIINVKSLKQLPDSVNRVAPRKTVERLLITPSETNTFTISNMEELKFTETGPKQKRFRFWLFSKRLINPEVYFIELTNENATAKTDMETFIDGAELTFFKDGWIVI